MHSALLRAKIKQAEEQVQAAQRELDGALRELEAVPGTDRTMVTEVVRRALGELHAARQRLAELEELTPPDDGDG
jgi:hypothetical protein